MLTGGWSTSTATSGSQTVGPLATNTTYSMTCNNNSESVTESITVIVNPIVLGSVELTWTPPDSNEDGSRPLLDLDAYRIYYGTSMNNLANIINIDNEGLTSYVIDNLPAATYYFSITAIDKNNNESPQSTLTSKVVN